MEIYTTQYISLKNKQHLNLQKDEEEKFTTSGSFSDGFQKQYRLLM